MNLRNISILFCCTFFYLLIFLDLCDVLRVKFTIILFFLCTFFFSFLFCQLCIIFQVNFEIMLYTVHGGNKILYKNAVKIIDHVDGEN